MFWCMRIQDSWLVVKTGQIQAKNKLNINCQSSWLLEWFHQGNTDTSNFRVKTDHFSRRYILQFSKDLRSLVACAAGEDSKEYPEAILPDTVWHDSLSPFPFQHLMERNWSKNGSGSMEEMKKREDSLNVKNWIQQEWNTKRSKKMYQGNYWG